MPAERKPTSKETVVKTACSSHCGGRCLLQVHLRDGVITWIETDTGIAPGIVRTEGTESLLSDPETLKRFESVIPQGRIAVPGDIVGAALFLASAASSHISGQTIVVDGGVQA